MNDLVKRLNARIVWWQSSNRNNREYDVTDCDLDEEVVDHIEAQNKLIEEMREAYEHYELALATREHGVVAMGRLVSAIASIYSKSNPNTPERNDK